MDSFHSHMLKLAATHVRYTNDHMRSTHHHSVYQKEFVFRRILPSVRINTDGFLKYGLDPGSLIGNLGWKSLISNRRYSFYSDAVRQFYANIQLEGRVQDGCFSTFVEGHHIFVTPQLLTQVLGIPSGGLPIFDESDFSRVGFDPSIILLRWLDIPYHVRPLSDVAALPKYLRVLHFFIARVLLPRSVGKYLVNSLDVWILYCAMFAVQTDYSCLMFGTMVHYSNSQHPGDLPFGPAISFLLTSLGIPLGSKFSADSPLDIFRPSFALREVGWHLSSFVVDSGGVNHSPVQDLSLSDDEEENQLVEELERALQIEEALAEAASDID
ncbi:hypothetical protein LINGRAPRIM_LOCUS3262 [Linum grandiflorum]